MPQLHGQRESMDNRYFGRTMTRYFKKEIPSNPLYLPNGKRVAFRTVKNVGILATNDAHLLIELDKVLIRRIGGLFEIDECDYLNLREQRPESKKGPKAAPEVGIDQLYIKWKIGRGRMIFRPKTTGLKTVGRFIHVLERHRQPDADSERRILNAFWSWVDLYKTGVVPCHVWDYPRSSRTIGDPRELPYLKDVLAEGLKLATAADDVVMLTNDDTVLHRAIIPSISIMLRLVDCCTSFRMNFEQDNMPATDLPVAKIKQWGETCFGRDLFAFRAGWLKLNWDAIPDFLLGEQEWDLTMATMIRAAAGVMTTKSNFALQQPKCELDRGYVMHEIHTRNWMNEKYSKSPAKIHNNRLYAEFCADNGFESLIGEIV